jgi:hypothetical protein
MRHSEGMIVDAVLVIMPLSSAVDRPVRPGHHSDFLIAFFFNGLPLWLRTIGYASPQ